MLTVHHLSALSDDVSVSNSVSDSNGSGQDGDAAPDVVGLREVPMFVRAEVASVWLALNRLFVPGAYKYEERADSAAGGQVHGALLQGFPGVGKSILMWTFALCRVQRDNMAVLHIKVRPTPVATLITPGGCWRSRWLPDRGRALHPPRL